MLSLKNIHKSYDGRKILNGIDFDFTKNGLYLIKGKNGCGKSTLLKIILGDVAADQGQVFLDDREISSLNKIEKEKFLQNCLSYIPQEVRVPNGFTLKQYIKICLEIAGKSQKDFESILRKFSLIRKYTVLEDTLFSTLSGGEKQLFLVCAALIKSPKLLLIDEPTSFLDDERVQEFKNMLDIIAKDTLILMVTHDSLFETDEEHLLQLKEGKFAARTLIQNNNERNLFNFYMNKLHRLSLRSLFSMCVTAYKRAFKSIAVNLALSILSLSLLTFSFVCMNNDRTLLEVENLQSKGNAFVQMDADSYAVWRSDPTEHKQSLHLFSDKQVDVLKEYSGYADLVYMMRQTNFDCFYGDVFFDLNITNPEIAFLSVRNPYISMAFNMRDYGVVELPRSIDYSAIGLTIDERFIDPTLCRYPESPTEIALTDYHFDIYQRYGYQTEEGEAIEINTPDDLIGKTVHGVTVTGIFKTTESADKYKEYDGTYPAQDQKYRDIWLQSEGNHLFMKAFSVQGQRKYFIETREGNSPTTILYASILIPARSNGKTLSSILKDLKYSEQKEVSMEEGETDVRDIFYYVGVNSEYHEYYQQYDFLFWEEFLTGTKIIGVVFAFFSLLSEVSLFKFLNYTRRESLSIFAGNGMPSSDFARMGLIDSVILSFVQFTSVLALIFTATIILNVKVGAVFILPTALPILYAYLIALGLGLLSDVFPLLKSKKIK